MYTVTTAKRFHRTTCLLCQLLYQILKNTSTFALKPKPALKDRNPVIRWLVSTNGCIESELSFLASDTSGDRYLFT